MSRHPSLKAGNESKQHKSVLKRLEKVLHLMKKDSWKEGDSVYSLPKIKVLKFKIKKEKTKETEETAAGAPAAGSTAAGAPAAGAKTSEKTPKAAEKTQKSSDKK